MTKISHNTDKRNTKNEKYNEGPHNYNTHKHKCDVCKISYEAKSDLTTHHTKIHTQHECKVCKSQKYGENGINDHTKSCKHKRDMKRKENNKKDAERKKAHPTYKNMFMHLMDETPDIIEKITEEEKIENEIKREKKEERIKTAEEKRIPEKAKKLEEIYEATSKEERMKIDREREEKQKIEDDKHKKEYEKKNRIKTKIELTNFKEAKISKNLETEIQIERTFAERRRAVGAYKRIMEKIILDSKLTPERKDEFIEFRENKLKEITKSKNTLLDYYNHLIIFLKGISVLTWYTPCEPNKDKEPWLDRKLTDKWKPEKTVAQKDRLKEERKKMAEKILGEGPVEREKRRRKEKDIKVVRVLKQWRCNVYTCNAGRLSNKMAVLAHDAQKLKLGVIHISEAGVGPEKPMGLSGYTPLSLERSGPNRGSVMHIRNDIYPRCLRIFDKQKEEEETGAEIIQIQIDTIPATSIF